MEDFASQINQLLSSPEGMQQIQNIAAALGVGTARLLPQQPLHLLLFRRPPPRPETADLM